MVVSKLISLISVTVTCKSSMVESGEYINTLFIIINRISGSGSITVYILNVHSCHFNK